MIIYTDDILEVADIITQSRAVLAESAVYDFKITLGSPDYIYGDLILDPVTGTPAFDFTRYGKDWKDE